MERIYLDWAATSIPYNDILMNAAERACGLYGNPSSHHSEGKAAAAELERCRERLAGVFGCRTDKLYFTSGGTESNNLVLFSLLNSVKKGNIVVSGLEHPSVRGPAEMLSRLGWELRVPSARNGILNPADVVSKVDSDTALVSAMLVNNETGAVQPVRDIADRLKDIPGRRPHFHVDAVQAACKIRFRLDELGADSASLSPHKFSGPRGTGLLYLARETEPLWKGGGQEHGKRSGTENLQGIMAAADAAERAAADTEAIERALGLKKLMTDRFSEAGHIRLLPADSGRFHLDAGYFSPWILLVSVPPVPGEVMARVMNDKGFAVSTGSACSSGKNRRFVAMESSGIDHSDAFSAIRISTGRTTTAEETALFCDTFIRESAIMKEALSVKKGRSRKKH